MGHKRFMGRFSAAQPRKVLLLVSKHHTELILL